mmetsp:Transcript_26612/g.57713  ORF Transcript_26612/g.57713 Transcript_26612/m.57713 type:complete len:203 (+) Transcript_26612:261-869(+)
MADTTPDQSNAVDHAVLEVHSLQQDGGAECEELSRARARVPGSLPQLATPAGRTARAAHAKVGRACRIWADVDGAKGCPRGQGEAGQAWTQGEGWQGQGSTPPTSPRCPQGRVVERLPETSARQTHRRHGFVGTAGDDHGTEQNGDRGDVGGGSAGVGSTTEPPEEAKVPAVHERCGTRESGTQGRRRPSQQGGLMDLSTAW